MKKNKSEKNEDLEDLDFKADLKKAVKSNKIKLEKATESELLFYKSFIENPNITFKEIK